MREIVYVAGGILLAGVVVVSVLILLAVICLPFAMCDSPYGYWGRWAQLIGLIVKRMRIR